MVKELAKTFDEGRLKFVMHFSDLHQQSAYRLVYNLNP